jgi:hypothetical protein
MAKGRDKRRRRAKKQRQARIPVLKAETLPGESPGLDEPDARIYAPLKPKPVTGSGAIALPEPEEIEVVELRLRR